MLTDGDAPGIRSSGHRSRSRKVIPREGRTLSLGAQPSRARLRINGQFPLLTGHLKTIIINFHSGNKPSVDIDNMSKPILDVLEHRLRQRPSNPAGGDHPFGDRRSVLDRRCVQDRPSGEPVRLRPRRRPVNPYPAPEVTSMNIQQHFEICGRCHGLSGRPRSPVPDDPSTFAKDFKVKSSASGRTVMFLCRLRPVVRI